MKRLVAFTFALCVSGAPVLAFAQSTASQHSGSVHIDDMKEKHLFSQLRCMCGTCARELLSSCACSTADATRDRMRTRLAKGETVDQIIDEYVKEYGTASLAIPPNQGAMRLIYVAPVVALVGGGIGLAVVLRRWRANAGTRDGAEGAAEVADASAPKKKKGAKKDADADASKGEGPDDYDARIDAELKDLDG